MPAATTFLILKKDGKEKSWWPCPIVFNGEIPTNHIERVLFTKIPAGGGIPKGQDQHWWPHYTIFTLFPSNKSLSAFGAPGNKQALKSGHKWAHIPAPESPRGVEVLPTRSSAGRAQSARRARSSCSRQLPVGSIVSTFTQVPGLEETGRSKKTEHRCLNSSTNILSCLDKRHARKTSITAVQLLLQNTHNSSMHTHIQHPSVQPVSRARRQHILLSLLKPPLNSLCWNINCGKQSWHKHIWSPICSLESMSSITVKDHGSGCPDLCRSHSHTAFPNHLYSWQDHLR